MNISGFPFWAENSHDFPNIGKKIPNNKNRRESLRQKNHEHNERKRKGSNFVIKFVFKALKYIQNMIK